MAAKKYTKKELVKLAKEFNKVMDFDDPIDVKADEAGLVAAIKSEVDSLFTVDKDTLSDAAWEYATKVLKLTPEDAGAPETTAPKPKAKAKAKKEEAPAEREPELPMDQPKPKAKKASATKAKAKAKATPKVKAKASTKKEAKPGQSNKTKIYKAWKKMKRPADKMKPEHFQKIHEAVPGSNLQSIKTWIKYRWSKGKDLPAGS